MRLSPEPGLSVDGILVIRRRRVTVADERAGLLAARMLRRTIARMGLPRRRTLWLSAALLTTFVLGTCFFSPKSRIDRAHFDRIALLGMSIEDATAILGEPDRKTVEGIDTDGGTVEKWTWSDGPNWIALEFGQGRT